VKTIAQPYASVRFALSAIAAILGHRRAARTRPRRNAAHSTGDDITAGGDSPRRRRYLE
jgi:hypothetical protein